MTRDVEPSPTSAPLVSVVIPTHNRADLLPRAIASVLSQTMVDFELLVVDDGSDDHTESVVASLPDRRIRYLRLPVRSGPARARNHGVDAARGELIAFLDSDDEWRPPKLERQVARLRRSGDASRTLVYCPYTRYDALTGRSVSLRRPAREGQVFDHLVAGWIIALPTVLVGRALLVSAGGFDETLPRSEDLDLWLRLAAAGVEFAAVQEDLVIVHHHLGSQLTADPAAKRAAFQKLDTRWQPVIRATCGAASYRRWRAGQYASIQRAQFMRVRALTGRGQSVAAWRECFAMLRFVPWSRRFLFQALVLLTLGGGVYARLARAENAVRARGPRTS